ncbi:MAG TPA: aldose 1-epimerase [Candidatus Binatia bacterium]|nr:aldose 1-epimerase [Candidatus Binatia bacterium]
MKAGIKCRTALRLLMMLIVAMLGWALAGQEGEGPVSIGGEPVVILQRPSVTDSSRPQFLQAIVLPGRGMGVLQIRAFLPGKGEIELLSAPPLPQAKQLLDKDDDEFGNQVFKIGGATLVPFANRIRGKVAPDGKTITATVASKIVKLPANWSGNEPGAERHAIHGLMRRSRFQDVVLHNGPQDSSVTAVLHAGNFDGHWLSDTDVQVETTLSHEAFEMTVTAKNVGHQPLPMGIGWHPYFLLPGGDRQQVKLHLPSRTRSVMNNYDDTFTTGERVPVNGTPYDFSPSGGRPLGMQYLDDNFSSLEYDGRGRTVSEIVDPAAKYGLRLITLSPQIRSIQVYAPPQKNFVAIEPQFNLPDPYNRNWGDTNTGMVLLQPGRSATWRVRLELFTPKE